MSYLAPMRQLHLNELLCTLLSSAAHLSYATYCWAIYCTLQSYHAPELLSILLRAMLHPLSYTAPSELRCTSLSCTAFYIATLNPTEQYHTLLSNTSTCWAKLHLNELPNLHSANYWSTLQSAELPTCTLHPNELCCILLKYAESF